MVGPFPSWQGWLSFKISSMHHPPTRYPNLFVIPLSMFCAVGAWEVNTFPSSPLEILICHSPTLHRLTSVPRNSTKNWRHCMSRTRSLRAGTGWKYYWETYFYHVISYLYEMWLQWYYIRARYCITPILESLSPSFYPDSMMGTAAGLFRIVTPVKSHKRYRWCHYRDESLLILITHSADQRSILRSSWYNEVAGVFVKS